MNRLVQMVILNLDPAKGEKGSLELYTQPATDGTNESLIRYSSLQLSLGRETSGVSSGRTKQERRHLENPALAETSNL